MPNQSEVPSMRRDVSHPVPAYGQQHLSYAGVHSHTSAPSLQRGDQSGVSGFSYAPYAPGVGREQQHATHLNSQVPPSTMHPGPNSTQRYGPQDVAYPNPNPATNRTAPYAPFLAHPESTSTSQFRYGHQDFGRTQQYASSPTGQAYQHPAIGRGPIPPSPVSPIDQNRLDRTLLEMHQLVAAGFDTVHRNQAELLDRVTQVQDRSRLETFQLLDQFRSKVLSSFQTVHARLDHVERSVGKPNELPANSKAVGTEKSLKDRLQDMECTLLEILEKSNDPEADRLPPHITREIGTSPHIQPEYRDAAIEALVLPLVDVGVEARMADARPLGSVDVAVETTPTLQVDQGVDPPSPKSLAQADTSCHLAEQASSPFTPPRVPPPFHVSPIVALHTRFPGTPIRQETLGPAQWSRDSSHDSSDNLFGSPVPSGTQSPVLASEFDPVPLIRSDSEESVPIRDADLSLSSRTTTPIALQVANRDATPPSSNSSDVTAVDQGASALCTPQVRPQPLGSPSRVDDTIETIGSSATPIVNRPLDIPPCVDLSNSLSQIDSASPIHGTGSIEINSLHTTGPQAQDKTSRSPRPTSDESDTFRPSTTFTVTSPHICASLQLEPTSPVHQNEISVLNTLSVPNAQSQLASPTSDRDPIQRPVFPIHRNQAAQASPLHEPTSPSLSMRSPSPVHRTSGASISDLRFEVFGGMTVENWLQGPLPPMFGEPRRSDHSQKNASSESAGTSGDEQNSLNVPSLTSNRTVSPPIYEDPKPDVMALFDDPEPEPALSTPTLSFSTPVDALSPPFVGRKRSLSISSLSSLSDLSPPNSSRRSPAPSEQLSTITTSSSSVPLAHSRRSGRRPKKKQKFTEFIDFLTSKKRKGRPPKVSAKSRSALKEILDPVVDCDWPEVTSPTGSEEMSIQCTGCLSWYHLSCVGVTEDHECLRTDKSFYCPPCQATREIYGKIRKVTSVKDDTCARPSCTNPSLAEPGRFFVDHIIGRKPHCGNPGSFRWLVKWEGYPIADASWQTQADFPRSEYYTCAFDERARREGHDVSDYNSNILLREARDAGWR
ncbi:unnamed protein product [Somion occarium]|uniref:Chromo domain-containing protein n=1 Tax=Somion occarium TaxID=3059160 RepID=A0ABP1CUL3_9APHY